MEARFVSSRPTAAPNAHAHTDRSGTKLENLDALPALVGLALGSGRTGFVATDAPTDGDTT
jgi:hypothetical protein